MSGPAPKNLSAEGSALDSTQSSQVDAYVNKLFEYTDRVVLKLKETIERHPEKWCVLVECHTFFDQFGEHARIMEQMLVSSVNRRWYAFHPDGTYFISHDPPGDRLSDDASGDRLSDEMVCGLVKQALDDKYQVILFFNKDDHRQPDAVVTL